MSHSSRPSDKTSVKHRVVVLGKSWAPDCMESHVVAALHAMGHDAWCLDSSGNKPGGHLLFQRVRYRIETSLLREPERIGESRLARRVADLAPDLVLVIQGNQLSPKTVAALRRVISSPIVCWCQDAISSYGRQHVLGAEYDAVFLKDPYLVSLFSGHIASTQFHYLPEACNPDVHRPMVINEIEQQQYGCEVLMLGSLYYYRQELLRQLHDFDLHIYGNRPAWLVDRLPGRHRGSDLILDQKAKAVAAAKVSLNPLHCAEIDGLNCRAFELAGCGGFQIMNLKPVLQKHFEPGEEVETFSSMGELKEKLHYYLKNPDQARVIAKRGQQRAHREHTYQHRMAKILEVSV